MTRHHWQENGQNMKRQTPLRCSSSMVVVGGWCPDESWYGVAELSHFLRVTLNSQSAMRYKSI